jgi:hypothetical protein
MRVMVLEWDQSKCHTIVRHDNYSPHEEFLPPELNSFLSLGYPNIIISHASSHTHAQLLHIYTYISKMLPSSLIEVRGALRNTFQATMARSSLPRASKLLASSRLQSNPGLRFRTVHVLHPEYIPYRILDALTT